jgi:polysaccharide biosynthesis transport protein
MTISSTSSQTSRPGPPPSAGSSQVERILRLILYRKWLICGIFVLVTGITIGVVQALPNIYTAQTLILVDPQKVPETYVKSTVTGSIRDRLSTLSQQILSATRLQKIIDTLNLYQAQKKKLAREEIISKMRKDISTTVVSDFGAGADLQAFRISYSGTDPRLVAQVTNQLANLFIEENLRAREQQSTGTTEFLENQLEETRKKLEGQEGQLRDFRLKHIGEMPEQQNADLQILGQLQSQMQLEGEALSRAEQQKTYLQSLETQAVPVVDLDGDSDDAGPAPAKAAAPAAAAPAAKRSPLAEDKAKLAELLTRYKETYPDVIRLKKRIQEEEAKESAAGTDVAAAAPRIPVPPPPPPPAPASAANPSVAPARHFNPVLQAQIESADAEIAKHRQETERLSKQVANYRAKLETIPVREQEITALQRDYEMTKGHYAQLEGASLSAETATQLEFRQKGERFIVLDPAIAPEKPSKPNRPLLEVAGAVVGLVLGVGIAMLPELFGMTIINTQDITSATNLVVLESIPVITTRSDKIARRRRALFATASAVLTTLAAGVILFLRYRDRI